jgi:ElaB/YqjD/DUF883 family membrane-anchored ribosome-binding protein
MMDQAVEEFDRAGGRMASDFRTVIADGEALLKSAKAALADGSQPLFDRARDTAGAADEYVRGNPWTSVGVAVAAGLLIGFLVAKR